MAELVIGVAATPSRWRRDLYGHVRDHVAGVELRVLQDAADALAGGIHVVVVDDTTEFLTPTEVLALQDQGVQIVGLYDPRGREGRGLDALTALQVETTLDVNIGPDDLLDKVARVAPERARTPPPPPAPLPAPGPQSVPARPGPNGSDRQVSGGRVVPVAAGANGMHSYGKGQVLAVSGGSDSPGRTELAIGLAGSLAARGVTVVLVDLDEHNPSVARRLGYHLAPNVIDALGAAATGRTPWRAVGQRADIAHGPVGYDVICGLSNPADWAQLRDVGTLLTELRSGWSYVVIDTGPSAAPDQVPPGGTRNSATRTALRSADQVLAVCNPTRLGVLRLLDWASAAVELLDHGRQMSVVINHFATERFHAEQLSHQIQTNLPSAALAGIGYVPRDNRVTQAQWDASPVPGGPFTTGVDKLVDALTPLPRPAGRKLRRPKAARR